MPKLELLTQTEKDENWTLEYSNFIMSQKDIVYVVAVKTM